MMDIDHTIALVKRINPAIKGKVFDSMKAHFSSHHLTPEHVGQMAKRAAVKHVVVTHMAPGLIEPSDVEHYTRRVKAEYGGEVDIAFDLDRF